MKPKIVMVIDDPNWAFAISAQDMVKYLSDVFDFKIISWYDDPSKEEHYKDADLVYLFGHYMYEWMPANFDFSKACTGIRALFGYVDDEKNPKQSPWNTEKARHILKYPKIHTVSQESYDIFKEYHPDVEYVCHGVDTDFFTQKKEYAQNRPFVLGWAGNRSNLTKGIDLVDNAIKGGRTETILKTAEFGDRQLNREELRDFYQSLDAFVLPSISEGCSAALLEAMSCGLPIIATDTGTWLEFKDLGGGVSMERSTESFNQALNKLLRLDPNELKRMGDINRKEMVKNWDWKVKAKDFERFFKSALKTKRSDRKTLACFEEKWKMMPKGYGFKDFKQVEFFLNWAVKKYGFDSIDELNKFYRSKTNILEVGFGSAFNIKYMLNNTKAKITGVDASYTACKEAEKLFDGEKNVSIIHGNLLEHQSKKPYDLIIADGVLHHLENTKVAIQHLYSQLADGGDMYVYLYKKVGPVREFTNDWMRFQFRNLEPQECAKQCEELTKLGQELSKIKMEIEVGDIPVLNLKPGRYTPHELFYYGVLKCFWNDSFTFEVNNLNNYDWFYPEFAWRFSQEEVEQWMRDWGYIYQINDSNQNGISLLIHKL